jgi:ribosomal 30S subunit maturation factor RimM
MCKAKLLYFPSNYHGKGSRSGSKPKSENPARIGSCKGYRGWLIIYNPTRQHQILLEKANAENMHLIVEGVKNAEAKNNVKGLRFKVRRSGIDKP